MKILTFAVLCLCAAAAAADPKDVAATAAATIAAVNKGRLRDAVQANIEHTMKVRDAYKADMERVEIVDKLSGGVLARADKFIMKRSDSFYSTVFGFVDNLVGKELSVPSIKKLGNLYTEIIKRCDDRINDQIKIMDLMEKLFTSELYADTPAINYIIKIMTFDTHLNAQFADMLPDLTSPSGADDVA